jgi:hypothetical protein
MENCDDWKAARNEAGQDATPAKHAYVCVIPNNKGTKWNSMDFESYSICKDVNG